MILRHQLPGEMQARIIQNASLLITTSKREILNVQIDTKILQGHFFNKKKHFKAKAANTGFDSLVRQFERTG